MRTLPIKIGQKINRLKCLEIEETSRGRHGHYALFICDCGTRKKINISNVFFEKTKSCGCFRTEQIIKRSTKHGDRKSRLYRIYTHMKSRCYDQNNQDYYNYGARGIKVCNEWKINYSKFKKWAEKNGYHENLSIDRINGNKGYSPKNCRWSTPKEQTRNIKTNLKFKREIATDASKRLGGNKSLVSLRVSRGWPKAKAFTTPIKKYVTR